MSPSKSGSKPNPSSVNAVSANRESSPRKRIQTGGDRPRGSLVLSRPSVSDLNQLNPVLNTPNFKPSSETRPPTVTQDIMLHNDLINVPNTPCNAFVNHAGNIHNDGILEEDHAQSNNDIIETSDSTLTYFIKPVKCCKGKAYSRCVELPYKSILRLWTSPGTPATCDVMARVNNSIASPRNKSHSSSKKHPPKVEKFSPFHDRKRLEAGLNSGLIHRGHIRINPKHPALAFVSSNNATMTDFVISKFRHRNRALDGDEVAFTVAKEKGKERATVVYILDEVHNRKAVGFVRQIERGLIILQPRDPRIPRIILNKSQLPNGLLKNIDSFSDKLFEAKITKWSNPKFAEGHIVNTLGPSGNLAAESKAILCEFDINVSTKDEEQHMLNVSLLNMNISDNNMLNRMDLRKACIFTIDPATAKDLDDAVSCKRLENGNFVVGVHIADPSFYIKLDSKLDFLVRDKATSTYFVDRVYHMLPDQLCEQCSLLPGKDKLAFSVIWEMTEDCKIVRQIISRSIIRSCGQLAYEHAQAVIESLKTGADANIMLPKIDSDIYKESDILENIRHLHKLAVRLRENRVANGALRIDQIRIKFNLDHKTGDPLEYVPDQQREANWMIEEFMLLANISVAQYLVDNAPGTALLRSHSPPKQSMMAKLKDLLQRVGINLDMSSSGALNTSLMRYKCDMADDVCDKEKGRWVILNRLMAKPMARAKYFCTGDSKEASRTHFALSVPLYTHFTSPIRRYADMVVHRQLDAILNDTDEKQLSAYQVIQIAKNCNRRKAEAKMAGNASIDLYLAHYVRIKGPLRDKAAVLELNKSGLTLICISNGADLRIPFSSLNEDKCLKWSVEEIQENDNTKVVSNSSPQKVNEVKQQQIGTEVVTIVPPEDLGHEDESEVEMEDDEDNILELDQTLAQCDLELEVSRRRRLIIKIPDRKFHTVIEMFSVVNIEVSTRPNTNQLAGKLVWD